MLRYNKNQFQIKTRKVKKMKKIGIVLMVLVLLIGCCACSGGSTGGTITVAQAKSTFKERTQLDYTDVTIEQDGTQTQHYFNYLNGKGSGIFVEENGKVIGLFGLCSSEDLESGLSAEEKITKAIAVAALPLYAVGKEAVMDLVVTEENKQESDGSTLKYYYKQGKWGFLVTVEISSAHATANVLARYKG